MAYDYEHLEAFTLKLAVPGCTDGSAGNYNPEAEVDDGTCIELELFQCIENSLLSIDLAECHHDTAKRNLRIYTVYKMYQAALKEKNQVKIDMYKKELKEMCDAQYCESC